LAPDNEPSTKKNAVRFLLIGAAVVLLAGVYAAHVHKDMSDFGVCYRGGQRIIQGETLYRESDGHLQFKYSPASALFFALFALLPYGKAKVLWFVLEILCLAAVLFFSFRILPPQEKRAAPLYLWTFLILFKFLAREIELGQVNLLIILVLTMILHLGKKEAAPGGLWGFSLLFKPYALVFLPYFLIKKRFRTVAAGLAALAAGLALPALWHGFKGNLLVLREWPVSLSRSTKGLLASYDNASLFGFLFKALPAAPNMGVIAILVFIALLLAVGFLWLIREGRPSPARPRPEVLESAFLFILIPLFSPLGWNYNYLYSLLAVMLIVSAFSQFPRLFKTILIINFLVISTSLVEIWGRTLFHFYTQKALVAVNFLVVLAGLFYLRLKQVY
jgi:hypothetical protein